jgi:hypothetical protein
LVEIVEGKAKVKAWESDDIAALVAEEAPLPKVVLAV